jgi:hypothetical protein
VKLALRPVAPAYFTAMGRKTHEFTRYAAGLTQSSHFFTCAGCRAVCNLSPEGFSMKVRTIVFGAVAGLTLLTSGFLAGQDVSWRRHPNLAEAQRLIDQAYSKISAAQDANEFDMSGHAAKAKEHLEQANREIKLAAEAANHR